MTHLKIKDFVTYCNVAEVQRVG